MRTPRRTWNWT